jgi:DNA-binding MarR family transcriptional regulator
MKELMRLINEWAAFMEKNPKATVENFCKYFLAKSERVTPEKNKVKPPDLDGHFMKVIMRLSQSYIIYARIALKNTHLPIYEYFTFLAVSRALGESRKSDVINFAMIDLSTGSDILSRLIKDGYLKERTDPNDKRSKLISITSAGEKVLQECFKKTLIARRLFLKGLSDEDKKLCIQILEPSETRHSVISVESKNKSIEEIEREYDA